MEKNPDFSESLNRIGEILQAQVKKGLDLVINDYCSVVNKPDNSKILSTDFELYIKLAEILTQKNYGFAALVFYHILWQIQPNNLDISQKIETLLEQKKF